MTGDDGGCRHGPDCRFTARSGNPGRARPAAASRWRPQHPEWSPLASCPDTTSGPGRRAARSASRSAGASRCVPCSRTSRSQDRFGARNSSSVSSSVRIRSLSASAVARMISSSVTWVALASRFCVVWIGTSTRIVAIVVPVLTTGCHVPEKSETCPDAAWPTITAASRNVASCPGPVAVQPAMRANGSPVPDLRCPAPGRLRCGRCRCTPDIPNYHAAAPDSLP